MGTIVVIKQRTFSEIPNGRFLCKAQKFYFFGPKYLGPLSWEQEFSVDQMEDWTSLLPNIFTNFKIVEKYNIQVFK